MEEAILGIVKVLAQLITERKGRDLVAIDMRALSSTVDCVLLANGGVDRHVIALARGIVEVLAKRGERPVCVEGMREGDWVVLDYTAFVVHLFIPEMRWKYRLEELWRDGEVIDLAEFEKGAT